MRGVLSVGLLAGVLLVAIPRAGADEASARFDLSFRMGDGGVTLDGNVRDGVLRAIVRRAPQRI